MSSLEQLEQTEIEKMMLNDVVPTLETIRIDNKEPLNKSRITINLQNNLILRLQEEPNPEEELNFILENKLINEKIFDLKYKGRSRIRTDVLKRLRELAESLKTLPQYPQFKRQEIEKHMENILWKLDFRVKEEYLKSISDCLEKGLSNYSKSDITSFILAVEKKFQ